MSWIVKKEKEERRQKLVLDAGDLLKAAHSEERELTEEESVKFESFHADADKLSQERNRYYRKGKVVPHDHRKDASE